MEKNKHKGKLQARILLSLLAGILTLQFVSATISYFVFEQDVINKRNEDMNKSLDSFARTFYTDINNSLISLAKQSHDKVYHDYKDRLVDAKPDSEIVVEYLEAVYNAYLEGAGMGLTRYGTPYEMLQETMKAIGTPSSSKYLMIGYIDPSTADFIAVCGYYDNISFPTESSAPGNTVKMGYHHDFTRFAEKIDNDRFVGVEYKDEYKGHLYASGTKLPHDFLNLWIISETDRSYITDQTRRFLLTFAWVSAMAVVTFFASLALVLQLVFIKRVKRLSAVASQFAENTRAGQFISSFELSASKRPDEIDDLRNNMYYLQSELIRYVDNLKNAVSAEERQKAEIALSSQIQLAALPSREIIDGKISITPEIALARGVGGDLYDYFYIDAHRFVFLIGDVSGKGIPAALFMMKSNSLIHFRMQENFSLAEEIKNINNELSKNNSMCLFITAFIGVVDTEANTLTYVNCGHEEPFIKKGDKFEKLVVDANLPLGLAEGFEFKVGEMKLNPGDSIFVYTDGVSEAEDIHGNFFTKPRILETLNENSSLLAPCLAKHMLDVVSSYQEGKDLSDDICMLALTYKPDYRCYSNNTQELERIHAHIDEICRDIENPDGIAELHVCVDELVANIINYAYEEPNKFYLSLSLDKESRMIACQIIDSGKEFDPTVYDKLPEPDQIGGLGISMVKAYVKTMAYQRVAGYNVLTFEKQL